MKSPRSQSHHLNIYHTYLLSIATVLSIVSISKIFDSVSPAVCLCIQAARISHSILNVPFYFYAKYFSDLLNFTVRHENYIIKHGALRSNEFGFQRTFLCYTILSLRMSIFIIVNSRIWRQTVMMKNTNSVASNYKYFEIHWTSAIWKIPEKQTTIAKRECRGFQSTIFFWIKILYAWECAQSHQTNCIL